MVPWSQAWGENRWESVSNRDRVAIPDPKTLHSSAGLSTDKQQARLTEPFAIAHTQLMRAVITSVSPGRT